jgi:Flp pilus assembly protein TadD
MGKFAEAVADFEAAVEQDPENEEFKEGLGRCRESLSA